MADSSSLNQPVSSGRPRLPWRKVWRYGSLLLALLLVYIILRSISFSEIGAALQTLDVGLLLLAYGLNVIIVTIMAYRWWVLYAIDPARPPYRYVLRVSFIGVLFNNLLPSTIGGDVYRTLYMAPGEGVARRQYARSFAIVFMDRLTGLLGLVLLGTVAFLLNDVVDIPGNVGLWTLALLATFALGLVLSMSRLPYDVAGRLLFWLPGGLRARLLGSLERLHTRMALFSDHKRLVFAGLLLSIAQRTVWFTGCYLVGRALGLDLSLLMYFLLMPIIEIVRLLPITVQGIGIREGLFILFFGPLGASDSQAALLAVLIYTLLSLNGLVGAGLYLWDRLRAPGEPVAEPPALPQEETGETRVQNV